MIEKGKPLESLKNNFLSVNIAWPKISIVTISHNQGVFLERCVNSIIRQNYPHLEYIIIDLGSTDNSIHIIEQYKDQCTYVLIDAHKTICEALNTAFSFSTGEIMACLDGDELYHDLCLYKVATIFMNYPRLKWITGVPSVVDTEDKVIYVHKIPRLSRFKLLNFKAVVNGMVPIKSAVFWRRELWDLAGGYIDNKYMWAWDYELWVRFSRLYPLYPILDVFSSYRNCGRTNLVDKKLYYEEAVNIIAEEVKKISAKDLIYFAPSPVNPPYNGKRVLENNSFVDNCQLLSENIQPDQKLCIKELKEAVTRWRARANQLCDLYDAFEKDSRLPNHFIRLIAESNNVEGVFFDFFDTFVYRLCDEPVRLFIQVARRLKNLGLIPNYVTDDVFCYLRQVAEEKARKSHFERTGNFECSIEEIYKEMKTIVTDIHTAARVELETEKQLCFLNPSIANLALYAKINGKKVAILSDTYYSANQIASILSHNQFPVEQIDLILTSSDVGACKSTGDLFRKALAKIHGEARLWVHIGDNLVADVKGAARAKLRAFLYPRYDQDLERISFREKIVDSYSNYSISINPPRVLASNMVNNIEEKWRPYFKLGATIWGPILARYIDWSIDECKKLNVKKALVFMREAHTLLPMFKNALEIHGVEIEAKPFFVSRHSVKFASFQSITPKDLFSCMKAARRPLTTRQILQSLNLSSSMVREIPHYLMDEYLNDAELFSLATILVNIPKYRAVIESLAMENRKLFVKYITQFIEGVDKCAIIDVGYSATIQGRIESILKQEGIKCRMIGLYFATSSGAVNKIATGSFIKSYLGKCSTKYPETAIVKYPEILEQSINSFCGTTLGYASKDGKICPKLEDTVLPEDQLLKRFFIQLGIKEFHRQWLAIMKKKKTVVSDVQEAELDRQCFYLLERLCLFPTHEEALHLGSLYHDDNNGLVDSGSLIVDDKSKELYRKRGFAAFRHHFTYWPYGVVASETPEILENLIGLVSAFRKGL